MRAWVPDFAVVGAPKCGTTSIFAALDKHPEISMSYIKEPHYFASDLPGCRDVRDAKTYSRLFRRRKGAKLRGEASTLYLYSQTAVPAMIAERPDLKVIAFVRNPIELFQSVHNELLKELTEEEENLEAAWHLQYRRAEGRDIPWRCREPKLLQYSRMCRLGEQVQRLTSVVPAGQCMVMAFDDLTAKPLECLHRILRFLGASDSLNLDLPWANAFAKPRSAIVSDVLRLAHTNRLLNQIQIWAKPTLNQFGISPIAWLLDMNLRRIPKPPLNPEFRALLSAEFAEDVALLGNIMGRNFDHWLEKTGKPKVRTASAGSLEVADDNLFAEPV